MSNKNNKIDYNETVLEVRNLEKHFNVGRGKDKLIVPAVDNISFDVYKREVFGIVGESGSGKTTAGRTIMKLYEPTNGYTILNGELIGAGYRGNTVQIRKIKRETKKEIRFLDKYKTEVYNIKSATRKEIALLTNKKDILKENANNEINKINSKKVHYKKSLYELKNQLNVDINKIIFDFNQKEENILNKSKNQAEIEYKKEVSIQNVVFSQKKDAIKDSAALTKAQREEELRKVNEENNSALELLINKFTPLIEEAKKDIIELSVAKEELKKLNIEKENDINVLKQKYEEDKIKIINNKPNFEQIKRDITNVKTKLKEDLAELNIKIKELNDQAKENIGKLEKNKKTIQELKTYLDDKKSLLNKSRELINIEKEKIAKAIKINKSKESLVHSRQMQMIFQDPISSLNPRMTVKEIISEGLIIQKRHTDAEIDAKVKEVLELVGLAPEYVSRYPHEFSGGQRQRIGIARALVMNPDFIIADEPISALDVSIRAQVINLLTELKNELGLTILFIAHDLSLVRFFCDRIAVMNNGKIVELATSEELFKHPMHKYTKSLLSAIPQPDPDYEKGRKRINYNPALEHDYSVDKPQMREIAPNHMVYANDKEFKEMLIEYQKQNDLAKKKGKGESK
ncbi:ATP-binding cassette domain-containing protein [Haploplasma modicum]|uniref:ATP-binding cassette domain-containing protein n=1 Tax=Haploplasma modicum TaxID=2150 RepID=UPI0022AAB34D|nr:ATP-binding cassette domain-containing protein [Haploplasma modicum]